MVPSFPKEHFWLALQAMMRTLAGLVLLSLLATPTLATQGEEDYPKVLAYSMGINLLPEAVQDTLSWYDVLVCMDRPETIESLRQSNPDQRYLWQVMPQYVGPPEGDNPWWLPDTLWSIKRLMNVYAHENDWLMKDTNGDPIFDGAHYLLNWTEYCPVGTFGTSKGLRAAEWMASVALPTIALSGRYWDTWSWDSQTAYNGYMFEILADCLGSYNWRDYIDADPDQDGQAEGVYNTCSEGGAEDPLSVLLRAENEIFFSRLTAQFPDDFVFLINENNKFIGPDWVTELSGMKLENWMRDTNPSWHDWWDWFYGLTPPWEPGENWGAGYAWAESEFDRPVADALKGWDLSFIETWKRTGVAESENLRQMRWGLGTAMLGDGYFAYTYDQRNPLWQPEFDYSFGTPLSDFSPELHAGGDTLYVRLFRKGMVEVNPYEATLNGVAARDSRFTFWLPVDDLTVETIGEHTARATWTAPVGEHNQADSYELRYATVPLGLDNWEQASSYAGNPVTANPGEVVTVDIDGLSQGPTYSFAIRTRTRGRLEPLLSNVAQAELGEAVDTVPPGMIVGLTLIEAGESWLDLAWTATGDDGDWGTAASQFLRYLPEEEITTEDDWARGIQAENLPPPGEPGSPETYRLTGLEAGRSYGIAVRARDDAANLSPLHPAFVASTTEPPPPPADTDPPGAIADLAGEPTEPGALQLSWSAPGDDGGQGQADRYEVRLLAGTAIETEADWAAAEPAPVEPPVPGPPASAETMEITSLDPGTAYGVAVRARDEADNLGDLSNPILVEAGAEPPPPEGDTIPPAAIDDLLVTATTDSTATFTWTAPGDDGDEGIAQSYELGLLLDETIVDEESWQRAVQPQTSLLVKPEPAGTEQESTIGGLLPGRVYGLALRARDEADNLGSLSPPLLFETTLTAAIDETPPEAVGDLEAAEADTAAILLRWTAPLDSGEPPRAALYLLRIAPDGLDDEEVWENGEEGTGLPSPSEPGATDSVRVTGLSPATRYGFALRSQDATGNLSALSNIVWAWTDSLRPPAPPAAIDNLVLVETGRDTARVAWTAPGDDGTRGRATRYHVRLRRDGAITNEQEWEMAEPADTTGIGRPAEAGMLEVWVVRNLEPATTYALAIRAEDDSSLLGALSRPLQWTTEELPPPPPPGPIADLAAQEIGESWCILSWSAPGALPERAEPTGYRLVVREGELPIATEEDWAAATDRSEGLPDPADPGLTQSHRLEGLAPELTYAIALRATDELGRLGALGGSLVVTTGTPPDTSDDSEPPDPPPAPIDDLAVAQLSEGSVQLTWTAVGEDSTTGQATAYRMRILSGRPFSGPGDWQEADSLQAALPPPAPAGQLESFELTGLTPGERYGIALRAIDAAGQISPWAGGLEVTIPEPPPPPDAVESFAIAAVDADRVSLEWTHPRQPGMERSAARFLVGLSEQPFQAGSWEEVPKHPEPPPPAEPGAVVQLVWTGLEQATTYWAAVQVEGVAGLRSALSPVLEFTTPALDLAPPEPPTALRVEGNDAGGQIVLSWEPSVSPDVAGYHLYGRDGSSDWSRVGPDTIPPTTTRAVVEPVHTSFALTAFDQAGNEGALSAPAEVYAAAVSLRGPFPHPVVTACRFEIELPASAASQRLRLRVRDAAGRQVRLLYDEIPGTSGFLEIAWDRTDGSGQRLAPGFYLVTLEGRAVTLHRRIFLSP